MKRILSIAPFLFFACRHTVETTPVILAQPNPQMPVTSISVLDFGAKADGISDDTHAFELAMQKADSLKLPVFIPVGIYRATIVLSYDNLQLTGTMQPDSGFAKGSIIKGTINCNNKKNTSISYLGIDSRGQISSSGDAALVSGTGSDSMPLHQKFNHISLIGDGYMDYKHGILCQTGSDVSIKNILVLNFYHGIAIRASNVTVDTIHAISCGFTSVVVKAADNLNAHTHNVSVDHVEIEGDPSDPYKRGGMVLVQSYEDISKTENILVRHVSSSNGGVACVAVQQIKGIVDNVTVRDCSSDYQGDNSSRSCFDVSGGSNILFENCSADHSTGYGFRATGSIKNIRVVNCTESHSNAGGWTGSFQYLQLNGKEIIK